MLCSEPIQRKPQRGGGRRSPPLLWWRPKAATFVLALNKAHVLALNTAHVLRLNKAYVLALKKAHASRLNNKRCPVDSQRKGNNKGGAAEGRPRLWRRPNAASFVLAVNTGKIFVLRRKTCALLRATTSASLRSKTCAVLRARTCALFRSNTKVTAFNC